MSTPGLFVVQDVLDWVSALADLRDGAVMKMLLPRLSQRPGLHLMHNITCGIEIVVAGDLGQLGVVTQAFTLVLQSPGLELGLGTGQTGRSVHLPFS